MTAPAQGGTAKLIPLWTPANGLDLVTPLSKLDLASVPWIQNFKIQDGYYMGREGTRYLNIYAEPTHVMASMVWQTQAGVEWIIRFTTTQAQYYDWGLGGWLNVSGITPNLSGGLDNYFQWTGYGDSILFVNGKDGLYRIALTGAPPPVTKITTTGAPATPRFVTTFGGRVIVSNLASAPSRVQWSVKNSYTDWSGIGSGYDDLISTPGGAIDTTYGIYPINDAQALVVRSNSIWLMSLTGDANVPHRFSQLYSNFGCEDPYSIVQVPGGIVGLFRDNVYFVNETTINPLGDSIKTLFRLSHNDNPLGRQSTSQVVGAYDPDVHEYRLLLKAPGEYVLRYGMTSQRWTSDFYPVKFRHIAGFAKLPTSPIVDSRLIMSTTTDHTVYETPNEARDVSGFGGYVDAPMRIWSGTIRASNPFQKTRLLKVFLEYEYSANGAYDDVDLQFKYSYDNVNWFDYGGPVTLNYTSQQYISRIVSSELALENRTTQLQIIINSLRPIKIYGAMLRVVEGTEEPQQ